MGNLLQQTRVQLLVRKSRQHKMGESRLMVQVEARVEPTHLGWYQDGTDPLQEAGTWMWYWLPAGRIPHRSGGHFQGDFSLLPVNAGPVSAEKYLCVGDQVEMVGSEVTQGPRARQGPRC